MTGRKVAGSVVSPTLKQTQGEEKKKQEMPAVVEKYLQQPSRGAPSPGVIQSKMTV